MNWDTPLNMKPCCMNLRHKLMYCDPRQSTPGLVDDTSDTRVFLCSLTQEVLGPDGSPVAARDCSDGRSCFHAPPIPIMPSIGESMPSLMPGQTPSQS